MAVPSADAERGPWGSLPGLWGPRAALGLRRPQPEQPSPAHPVTHPTQESSQLGSNKCFCPCYGVCLFTRLRNYFFFLRVTLSSPLKPC